MVDFIELQFATTLSNRLEHFKIKSTNPYKINFRCPICGDSKKSRTKARGWLLEDVKDQSLHFFCHNCGASHGFGNFLKAVDPLIYNDFLTSKYIDKVKQPTIESSEVEESFKTNTAKVLADPLKRLKKVSQLRHDHPAKKYITNRQIPPNQHYRIYYASKFKTWVNSILPGKFQRVDDDHPRLIFPFIGQDGKCFGVTGRGFDPNGLRYITIMFEDRPKIFGLDKVDFNKQYFIVEGSIDSFFLSNAIAMAGADGNTDCLPNPEKAIFVFDNEPRNKEIHKRMDRLIREGKTVCIWPVGVQQKDINDMVLAGIPNVEQIIRENTYKGLHANLKLAMWRKT